MPQGFSVMTKVKLEIEILDGKYCFGENILTPCIFYWTSEDGEDGCGLLGKSKEQESNTIDCEKFDGCPNPYKGEE